MTCEIVDLLQQVPMFRDVAPDIRSALAARASICEYRRETELFAQGERAAVLYVLFDGSLQLVATGADARAAVIEVVTPVEVFPLAAVLTAAPYPTGAIVVQPARLVGLPVQAFRATLAEDHHLVLATLVTLAGQSQRTVQRIKDLKLRSSSQRLACYLLEFARVASGATIDLPHDKKLIASHLGMTPESLSRAFATLRDYGVVNAGNLVTLTNETALRRFGQPDPMIDRDTPALAPSPHWQSRPSSAVPHRMPRRSARSGPAPRDGDHHA